LNLSAYSAIVFPPWVNWRNSTSLAYRMLSGKYSDRNLSLKVSHDTGSSLSPRMDLVLLHQCFAFPVSMYTENANLFSAGHIFTS